MDVQVYELLVRRKPPAGFRFLVPAGMLLSVLFWLGIFLINPFYIPLAGALVFTVGTVILRRKGAVEYEYSYVDGDLQIDRILYRKKRRTLLKLEASGIRLVAPEDASKLRGPECAGLRQIDVTSHKEQAKVYELLYEKGEERYRVLFEPDETLLKMMKLAAPRKITL